MAPGVLPYIVRLVDFINADSYGEGGGQAWVQHDSFHQVRKPVQQRAFRTLWFSYVRFFLNPQQKTQQRVTVVQTTTDHCVCQKYCSINIKGFANLPQIAKMIVTCLANLGNMAFKGIVLSQDNTQIFFTSTDGELVFWRSDTGKSGASDSLMGLSPMMINSVGFFFFPGKVFILIPSTPLLDWGD